jgi:hypothetical protein
MWLLLQALSLCEHYNTLKAVVNALAAKASLKGEVANNVSNTSHRG